MKVIFLDVDCKISSTGYSSYETNDIDEIKFDMLKEVIDKTGAKVVLTASWNILSIDERDSRETSVVKAYRPHIYFVLTSALRRHEIEIYDVISLNADLDKQQDAGSKAAIIEEWLLDMRKSGEVIDSYLILDSKTNDNWGSFIDEGRFIPIRWFSRTGGMSVDDIIKFIDILGRPENSETESAIESGNTQLTKNLQSTSIQEKDKKRKWKWKLKLRNKFNQLSRFLPLG